MAGGSTVILDTCALLWLASDSKKLSRSALKEINESPALYISTISAFEIVVKSAKGKLKLPAPAEEWFWDVIKHHGLTVLPLELDVCITAAQLPPIHNDPYDRFIIAAAKLKNLSVVTGDEQFEKYGVPVIC